MWWKFDVMSRYCYACCNQIQTPMKCAANTSDDNDDLTQPTLGFVQSQTTCIQTDNYINQLMLAIAASLGYLTIGLVRGYSSSAVISMEKLSPHLVPSLDAESWISAVPPLGAFFGSMLAGPLLERCGRKHTVMISAPLFVLGWVLIALASSYEMMVGARFLTGFCAGIVTPSAQVYVSECSDPGVRGVIGSMPALFMAGGILISYIMGAFLTWQTLAWASAAFPALLILVLLPLPESPPWLLQKGRHEEAAKALKWLHQPRLPSERIPMELRKSVVFTVGSDDSHKAETSPSSLREERSPFCIEELLRRPVIIPLLLSLTLLAFQQLSGIDAIIFYTVSIFESAGSPVDNYLATILVGTVQLVSNFVALFVIDRAGRRPLLIASGLMMAIALAALGTYFYLLKQHEADHIQLLPLISLLVFMVGFSIGYCTIPFLLMGELFPAKQRSLLSSVAGSFNLGVMFVVIKTYPSLRNEIGSEGTFWLYGSLCLCSCFFVGFFVPETTGKSLDEIEEYFETQHMSKTNTEAMNSKNAQVKKESDHLVSSNSNISGNKE